MRKMSTHTIATIPRLSATDLSKILLSSTSSNLDAQPTPAQDIAIVDVRDDDHIGGHIRTSIHAPSHTLDTKIPELVRKLQSKEVVVFHCALSQQRGPSAALRYLRERDRLLGGVGQALKKDKLRGDGAGDKGGEEDADGEWEDVDERKGEKEKEQKVYILERGFVGWQERFGEDSRLTEGYRKEIWRDGYWM